jgi:putative membrane protein
LAIDQFVDLGGAARPVLAITCAVLGLAVTVAGFRRWQGSDAAIRAGRPLPRPHVVPVLAGGLAIVSILVLAVVLSWP